MNSTQQGEIVSSRFEELARGFANISSGEPDFVAWVAHLLLLAFRDLTPVSYGGLIIPQLGPKAGTEFAFQDPQLEHAASLHEYLMPVLSGFWTKGAAEAVEHAIPTTICPHVSYLLISPVTFGSDRAVGYYWVILQSEAVFHGRPRLQYICLHLASAICAAKASAALTELAKSNWVVQSNVRATAQVVADACQKALSCPATVIWETDNIRSSLITVAIGGGGKLALDLDIADGFAGKCARDYNLILVDDLLDDGESRKHGLDKPYHLDVVIREGWRAAMFVPLDIGGQAAGVFAAYARRPRGFSIIDTNILMAFAHRLSAVYTHWDKLKQLDAMEQTLVRVGPAIEAGMLAIENVHDAVNDLIAANSTLSLIRTGSGGDKHRTELYDSLGRQIDSARKRIWTLARHSRMEEFNPKEHKLRALLSDAITLVRHDVDRVNIVLEFQCPQSIVVNAHWEKLFRVFVNLLNNSIWFLETDSKGGQKSIKIAAAQSQDGDTTITVYDNGPGIPPYHMQQIFNPLFTTRREQGLGFGLAIARRLVKEHGGEITVSSKWGSWTVFKITLPRSR